VTRTTPSRSGWRSRGTSPRSARDARHAGRDGARRARRLDRRERGGDARAGEARGAPGVRAAVDAMGDSREARGGAATGLPAVTWVRRAGAGTEATMSLSYDVDGVASTRAQLLRALGRDHVVVVRPRRCRSASAPPAAPTPARTCRTPRKRGTGRSDTDRPVHDPRLSDNPNVALPRSGRWLRTLVGHRPAMSFVEGHRTPTTMPTHELHVSRHYGGQFRHLRFASADRVPRVRGHRPGSTPCNRSDRRAPGVHQRSDRPQAPGPWSSGRRSPRAAASHPVRGSTTTAARPAAAASSA
jgi:hypothetical protein